MMAQTEEHRANRRGIRITLVVLALLAVGLYAGPILYRLFFD